MGFEVQQLTKSYPSRNGEEVIALQNVDLQVGEEEFVCIVGPSGCGKTTLLKSIAGLIAPSQGRIIYTGRPAAQGPRTAMVFQDQGLFPWMTVVDNVAFGLETQGMARKERRQRAEAFLAKVGLSRFTKSYPHELSGGMRQRVAILRAFLADPQILLMDEPFGALDSQTRLVMQEELLRIWREHCKAVVYITHDIEEAILLGDRVVVMSGRPGCILQEFPITLERPRQSALRAHPEFVEIQWQIWKMLEGEVRKELYIPE
jgi:NitT/TauT family transport system ATP-binding protein